MKGIPIYSAGVVLLGSWVPGWTVLHMWTSVVVVVDDDA